MGLILEVYRIEQKARELDILRTPAHRRLRQAESRPAMERFHTWLLAHQDRLPPRGPMGSAIKYALNQWDALCVFLDDEHVPPDNNRSENALRVIALGRKNWQLVGHEEAGQNTAVLHTIVACCAVAGVNPQEDLRGRRWPNAYPATHQPGGGGINLYEPSAVMRAPPRIVARAKWGIIFRYLPAC